MQLQVALVNAASVLASPSDKGAMWRRAGAAAERAVALAPDLADARCARGFFRKLSAEWDGARADLERAIALDPGYVKARGAHAVLLATLGRLDEAILEMKGALERDPLDRWAWTGIAFMYIAQGRADLARGAAQHAIEIDPASEFTVCTDAYVSLAERRPAQALAAAARLDDRDTCKYSIIAMAEHDLGHARASQEALDGLRARVAEDGRWLAAPVHAWRGEREEAFEILAKLPPDELTELKVDPALLKLRGDPRYGALLERARLPHN